MKLYETPRNSIVRLLEAPKLATNGDVAYAGEVLRFHHVDGMYSYCEDLDGNVLHPAAWTEVELVK